MNEGRSVRTLFANGKGSDIRLSEGTEEMSERRSLPWPGSAVQGRRRAVMGRKNDGPFLTPLITPAARRRRVNGVSGADGGGAPGDGPAVHERNEEAGRLFPVPVGRRRVPRDRNTVKGVR